MKKFLRGIRNSFVEGLIFILPIIIMFWFIYFIFKWFYGIFNFAIFFIPVEIRTMPFVKLGVTVAAFLVVLFLIVLFGLFVNSFLGRMIQSVFDRIFSLIPIFKTFYESLKQFSKIVLKERPSNFSSVVLVEFPIAGCWTVGFITSKIEKKIFSEEGKEFYSVFVPTSPNPTTGFTLLVEKEKLKKIDISIEEALKFVVFVGSVAEDKKDK
ncbi:MAG: DUF502 domain-containing protein [Brevinematia bacterium]